MKASFIIRFHSKRTENLKQLLRFIEKWHKDIASQSQLVLICQDKSDPISNIFERYDHFNLDLDYMKLPQMTNFGVEKCVCEKIILLDGDRVLPRNYFENTLNLLTNGLQITCKTTHMLQREVDDEDIERGKYDYMVDDRTEITNAADGRAVWSGNTAFMKSDFYKSGRMDESYEGYGYEDHDMTLTMEKTGIKSIFLKEIEEIHLWHERKTYGSGNHKQMFIDNGLRFCKKWKLPMPNYLREQIANHKKSYI